MNPRSAWTDTRGSGARMPSPEAGGVLLHYNGPAMAIGSHSECPRMLEGIRRFHVEERGWADIAYSYAACPHGEAYILRGPGVRTAANGTTRCNDRHHAVFLMLGKGEKVTVGHVSAAKECIAHAREHGKAGDHIGPHSQCKSTSCPGDRVRQRIAQGRFEPTDDGGFLMALSNEKQEQLYRMTQNLWHVFLKGDPKGEVHGSSFHDEVLRGARAALATKELVRDLRKREQGGATAKEIVDELSRRLGE